MKRQHSLKKIGLLAAVAFVTALSQVQAADMAATSGMLAEVSVMAVQAQANLAVAASSGDLNAIDDAAKRADAVDAALVDAEKAYDALATAPDEAAEDAALASLTAAHQKAMDALNGDVPEVTPMSQHEKWKESKTNTGGGPGRSYDPPNIYDIPSHSQGLRSLHSAVVSSGNSANGGSNGNSNNYGDKDATPE